MSIKIFRLKISIINKNLQIIQINFKNKIIQNKINKINYRDYKIAFQNNKFNKKCKYNN